MIYLFFLSGYLLLGLTIDYHSTREPHLPGWITLGWPIWVVLVALLYITVFFTAIYLKINLWWTLRK